MNFDATDRLLEKAVEDKIIPSAVYAIGCGRDVYKRGVFGDKSVYPTRESADFDTLYDLASISKLVSTTMVALRLIEDGIILLPDSLSRYFTKEELEGSPEGRANVTIFELMTHTSGISPHIPLWEQIKENDNSTVATHILKSKPVCIPGTQVNYSCMGFILLKIIIERVTGETLDTIAKRMVFDPLGMSHTCYKPIGDNIASTEKSPVLGYYLKGTVHDENAWFLGGVSGNAGVFSNLEDMTKFAVMLSTRGEPPGEKFGTKTGRFLSSRMFEIATHDYTPGKDESRGLGFHLKQNLSDLSAMGELMVPGSYGHNGYTGTSVYVDAKTGVWGVLLTNAVHFGRDKTRFFRMRRAFYNTMMSGVDKD